MAGMTRHLINQPLDSPRGPDPMALIDGRRVGAQPVAAGDHQCQASLRGLAAVLPWRKPQLPAQSRSLQSLENSYRRSLALILPCPGNLIAPWTEDKTSWRVVERRQA